MGDWEAATPPSQRRRAVALAGVAVTALLGGALVVLRDDRTPAPDLRGERATDAAVMPTEVAWTRPQPGLWEFMPAVRLTPRVGHANGLGRARGVRVGPMSDGDVVLG